MHLCMHPQSSEGRSNQRSIYGTLIMDEWMDGRTDGRMDGLNELVYFQNQATREPRLVVS